jgi:hypothetical protein
VILGPATRVRLQHPWAVAAAHFPHRSTAAAR